MLIGIDFDDVIYPYHANLKRKIKHRFGVDLAKERVTTFYYEDVPSLLARGATRPAIWALVQATWFDVDQHRTAVPLDPAIPKAIRRLRQRHRVVVVSARAEESRPHVQAFLKKFGIVVDEVRLTDAGKRGFDVIVDDFPRHAIENVESGGWAILFTIDENSNFDETRMPRTLRAKTWNEVLEAVDRIEELKDHA